MNIQLRPMHWPDVYLKSDGETLNETELGQLIRGLEAAKRWIISEKRSRNRKTRRKKK